MILILTKPKACGCCGKEHKLVTEFVSDFQLYWFECECRSTVVVKVDSAEVQSYIP